MTIPSEPHIHRLQFYATAAYQCSYLPDQRAQSLIAAPHHQVDARIYDGLIEQGFRRSGKFAYSPHCENCKACTPIRIPVDQFAPSRSQKRVLKKHSNLSTYVLPLEFNQEHFALYEAYQSARHDDPLTADKQEDKVSQYKDFLVQSNVESLMIEFRLDGELKMVSVVDVLRNGVSAVYTFYDTTNNKDSFGTYNVLWQIDWVKTLKLDYLYLGYWIKESPKMAYKENFNAQEKLIDGQWQ